MAFEAWLVLNLKSAMLSECCQRTLNQKEQQRHRAVSLRQHGFLVYVTYTFYRNYHSLMFARIQQHFVQISQYFTAVTRTSLVSHTDSDSGHAASAVRSTQRSIASNRWVIMSHLLSPASSSMSRPTTKTAAAAAAAPTYSRHGNRTERGWDFLNTKQLPAMTPGSGR